MRITEKINAVLCCLICLSACGNKEVSDILENTITTESTTSETTTTIAAEITTSETIPETTETEAVDEVSLYFDEENEVPENAVYKEIVLNCSKYHDFKVRRDVTFYDIHDNPILALYQATPDKTDYSKFEHFYEYNSDGTKSSEEYEEMHGRGRIEYEYSKGLPIRKTFFMNDNIEYTESYEYDEYDNPVKRVYESQDNSDIQAVDCYTYEYDDSGRILSKTTFHIAEQADVLLKEYYTYDNNGNVSSIHKEHGNGTKESVNYEYDSQNRIIKQEAYYDGQKLSTQKYEYEFYK